MISALLVTLVVTAGGDQCTYETWEWNVDAGRSENHRRISKKRSQLTDEERDIRSGCAVCSEDQVDVNVPGAPPFRICHRLAAVVRRAISEAVSAGFLISTVSGYRVGRSRGPVDSQGRRTRFSNHSYGSAIDINAEFNGLYGDCIQFSANCKLIRGGPWRIGQPGTVTRDSAIYGALKGIGWKWAGQLEGRQKDFMHFSLTGD